MSGGGWVRCYPATWIALGTGLSDRDRSKLWGAMLHLAMSPMTMEQLRKKVGKMSPQVLDLLSEKDGYVVAPLMDSAVKPKRTREVEVAAPKKKAKAVRKPRAKVVKPVVDPGDEPPPEREDKRKPDITECVAYLRQKIHPVPLDDSEPKNRQMAHLLLNKLAKQYPTVSPIAVAKRVIDLAIADDFHRRNATSMYYIWKHCGSIISKAQPKREENAVRVVRAEPAASINDTTPLPPLE